MTDAISGTLEHLESNNSITAPSNPENLVINALLAKCLSALHC
jgi:hypothetical protein